MSLNWQNVLLHASAGVISWVISAIVILIVIVILIIEVEAESPLVVLVLVNLSRTKQTNNTKEACKRKLVAGTGIRNRSLFTFRIHTTNINATSTLILADSWYLVFF
jgi:hypothetical protein